MIICQKCKAENPSESLFCSRCGTKLETPKPLQFNDNVIAGDVDMSTHTNVVNNYNSTTNVYQSIETRSFKCKVCGEPLEADAKKSVIICGHCNTPQAVPKIDDEKRAVLYDRANHFLRNKDFDKAIGIYEQILNIDNTDAEAYWSIVLCKYGIEYVDDPETFRKIPTCHRTSYDPIVTDDDYKSALKYASRDQRDIYEAQAKEIDKVQKDILALAQKEEKYDVFISFKDTDDASGARTRDSVIANDIYHQLTQEGFKVFFSRITLEDKLGSAYEPIIFAALHSAKVMLVIGTKPEYFNAVWVKNEWARYLKIISKDRSKLLIPCYRDMDAYDLPEEFAHLQAQDMSKIGFINDIIHGIKKIVKTEEPKPNVIKGTVSSSSNSAIAPLLKRAFMFLEDSKWDDANEYCERVLDIDPECGEAYLGKLMAEYRVHKKDGLKNCANPFDSSDNYKKAIRFGNDQLKSDLKAYIAYINTRNENARLDGIYKQATTYMTTGNYKAAIDLFKSIIQYKDSASLIDKCVEKSNGTIYYQATRQMNSAKTESEFKEAATLFKSIINYKDSSVLATRCQENAENAKKDSIYASAKSKMGENSVVSYREAITLFQSIKHWKDSNELINICEINISQLKAKAEEYRIERERQAEEARIERERQAEEARIERERQAELERQANERLEELARQKEKKRKIRKVAICITIPIVIIGIIVGIIIGLSIFYKNIAEDTATAIGTIIGMVLSFIIAIFVSIFTAFKSSKKGNKGCGTRCGIGCGTFIAALFISALIGDAIFLPLSGFIWQSVHKNDPPAIVHGEEVDADVLQSITLTVDKTEASVGDTVSISFTPNPSNPKKALVGKEDEDTYDTKWIEYYVRVNGVDKKISSQRTSVNYRLDQAGMVVFWVKYCPHSGCDGSYDIISQEVTVIVQ